MEALSNRQFHFVNMLRSVRYLHTSRAVLQEVVAEPRVIQAKAEIGDLLQYYKTPKDLRPLVYRRKNSSELLSRDLWDPVQKKRITPLNPPKIPTQTAFGKLLKEAKTVDELYELKSQMLDLAKKPKYTSSYHLNCFLEKSAELRKFPHALSYIYFQKEFLPVFRADNLNFILTMLYINPRKSFQNTISKVKIAKVKIPHTNDITPLLEASIYLKFKQPIPQKLADKVSSSTVDVSFNSDKSKGSLIKQIEELRFLYLQLSPIAEEFSNSQHADNAGVQQVLKFVSNYQEAQTELGLKDNFKALQGKSIFRKPRQPPHAPKEEAEE